MNIIDRLKSIADNNDDGKVSKKDLDSLKGEHDASLIDNLKMRADLNHDGKLTMDDLKSIVK